MLHLLIWLSLLSWSRSFTTVPRKALLARRSLPSSPRNDAAHKRKDRNNNALHAHHQLSIDYCTGCKWNLRAFWMAQELLTTFEGDLDAITLIPSGEAGIFRVRLSSPDTVLWDRKERGGFPELKDLKQIVRDQVDPGLYLGHSDSQERQEETSRAVGSGKEEKTWQEESEFEIPKSDFAASQHITIAYCTGCRWMMRAAYYAQELMSTFEDELASVSLVPLSPPAPGGSFIVKLNDETTLWDRGERKRFPETKELKQIVRDQLAPLKDLGHSDNKMSQDVDDEIDEDEAADARKFFGVM